MVKEIKNRMITERQRDYIKILSSYPSTKNEDEKDIQEHLNKLDKERISDLSSKEASELIQRLLKRQSEYEYPCGKKDLLDKQDINRFNVIGEIEACMHSCPDENICGDVNSCPYWKGYQNGREEAHVEAKFFYVPKLIENNCWEDKCSSCNKFIISDSDLFEELKELYPEKVVFGPTHYHHLDYEKEKTVMVCPSCHPKIHKDPFHPLYPKNTRQK